MIAKPVPVMRDVVWNTAWRNRFLTGEEVGVEQLGQDEERSEHQQREIEASFVVAPKHAGPAPYEHEVEEREVERPRSTMNSATTHCVIGAKSSSERFSVENPPRGIVVSAFPKASNGPISSSRPASPIRRSAPTRTSVSPM